MKKAIYFLLFSLVYNFCIAQSVPIESYSVNNFGQVQLEIQAQADKYYLLRAQHAPNSNYESITSITQGVNGSMIISEPAGAYEQQNYTITEHTIASPIDVDNDGIDDITELNNLPTLAPLNFAGQIPASDGTVSVDSRETFSRLAIVENDIPWAPFLNNQEFVKFAIISQFSDVPEVYFIDSETHPVHGSFLGTLNFGNADVATGEIVYNPNDILPNGVIGSYSFNYSFGASNNFEFTQRTFELLVANMPFLQNNMKHFIGSSGEANYNNLYKDDFIGSRIEVDLESGVFENVDFIPFNQAEGFGFFKHLTLEDNPGSRDIVLYDALPNNLPRVGGIITSVIQTPLSHVNLRAIQDNVPNAFIQNPLSIDSIANLLNKFIYYKVESDNYFIREATIEEVNAWYEDIRPTEEQTPDRDLSFKEILPLDSIEFGMSTAFGAKCSNVATMRKFGFPEGTIPNGYGIPFYFYDEFMKFNNFYEEVEEIITDPDFISDLETRIDMLKDFRKKIRAAPLPQWMLDELQEMHDSFPEGTSVRVRSSTNNEDLPGFSGAGLYTSKTQHPVEGHISKSVKQVYASIWNFRAFDERDFYRIDHFIAAMGLLCHPNYQEEKSNGVGVSIDPVFQNPNTFYLNTQVGESLITNPDANSIPEEMLLYQDPEEGFFVLRESNLTPMGELVMGEEFINQMRDYLGVIHDEFAVLYDVVGAEGFGMDIEYKVTAQNQLIIKQARPWVSFWAGINSNYDLGLVEITNPRSSSTLGNSELVTAKIANQGLSDMSDFDISLIIDGQHIETLTVLDTLKPFNDGEYEFNLPYDFSVIKDYNITAIVMDESDGYSRNDTINMVLSKLHLLEGGIVIDKVTSKCSNEIDVNVLVTNLGENTFSNTEIEVLINEVVVDTILSTTSIPYLEEAEIEFSLTENLQQSNNELTVNLLTVNQQEDAIIDNNQASTSINSETIFDFITLVINPDDYPSEISWRIVDEFSDEEIASGELAQNTTSFREDFCVDYSSCTSIFISDQYGNGIEEPGGFLILNSNGDTLAANNGQFGFVAQEIICPNGEGCAFTADITVTNATGESANNGIISISIDSGVQPFEYSIDGGQTFTSNGTFTNLALGEYMIVLRDASKICTYEETVTIDFDVVSTQNDISSEDIKVYPNPTSSDLTFAFGNNSKFSSPVKIEIYDNLGRLIQREFIANDVQDSNIIVPLSGFAPGSYIAKCYNENFEQFFKLIKI